MCSTERGVSVELFQQSTTLITSTRLAPRILVYHPRRPGARPRSLHGGVTNVNVGFVSQSGHSRDNFGALIGDIGGFGSVGLGVELRKFDFLARLLAGA